MPPKSLRRNTGTTPNTSTAQTLTLGRALKQAETAFEAGKFALVARTAQAILAQDPHHSGALHLLGRMALKTGAFEIAEGLLARARTLRPKSSPILADYGRALLTNGKCQEGMELLQQAVDLEPRNVAALTALGESQVQAGKPAEALATYRRILKLAPHHLLATHMAAALDTAGTASNAYVAELFDSYVKTFDEHLTQTLQYRVPQLLREATDKISTSTFGAALDIGCGTGLVARAFAGRFGHIDGLDLSPAMVDAARDNALYRHLAAGDAADLINRAPEFAGPYDIILAGDVFVYVGDLEAIFAAAAPRLKTGGLMVFSLEHSDDPGITLRASGRFAHGEPYITDLAARHGLDPVSIIRADLRKDQNQPIAGRICVLQKS